MEVERAIDGPHCISSRCTLNDKQANFGKRRVRIDLCINLACKFNEPTFNIRTTWVGRKCRALFPFLATAIVPSSSIHEFHAVAIC